MNLSPTVQYALLYAKAEGKNLHLAEIGPEFLFMGILKVSEMHAAEFLKNEGPIREATDRDIDFIRKMLKAVGVDSAAIRAKLRDELAGGSSNNAHLFKGFMERAEENAEERGETVVWGQDLLQTLLCDPTDTLLYVLPNTGWKNRHDLKPLLDARPKAAGGYRRHARREEAREDADTSFTDSHAEENSPAFLQELTGRVRHMRQTLLNTVQGQDHVVHAFTEGIFAAEVLAASDEKRVRPRAIFVFAGPPGVGKTFLAEQAAEALSLPFKRFDMSGYSDHQAQNQLIGYEKSYQGAKEGTLTGFVHENPHSILLFDEIEKAHLNTIQLFLQVLDAGRLHDNYLDEDIPFKDTIIIFTSNAGRSLYEGEGKGSAAGIPRKTILSALETEKDPTTGQPFFPAAITSRIATGWPLLFSHLAAHDLEKISGREMTKFAGLFEKQYGLKVNFDDLVPTALLFREGGAADARTVRAQTELFFKNEIFKVCRLWNEKSFAEVMKSLKAVTFEVDTSGLTPEIRPLFYSDEKPEILLVGDPVFAEQCRASMPGYVIHHASGAAEALKVAGEKDVRMVILDITVHDAETSPVTTSAPNFDYAPMAAGMFQRGNKLFRTLHERLPELPVYILETPDAPIDSELEMSFVRAGARGKLVQPEGDFTAFEETLSGIARQLYMQSVAANLAAERKVLYFETAPRLSPNGSEVAIRIRDFSLKRAAAADDTDSILDDVEKPDTRFADVVGAADAKDELQFFIDYLKNPKKFVAQGLKPPKGVLLYGPPGTGKTMLARAMAGESSVAFLPAAASTFVTKWQGSGPEAVRELFRKARRYAPAILFIDEIDAIGRKRGENNGAHGEEMALNAMLTEMDGFSVDPRRPVFVLAATNFDVEEGQGGPGVIDAALARRFDRKILVDLPNEEEREKLLRILLKKRKGHTVTEEMIKRLAGRSMGMSPANLTAVLELADRMSVKAKKPLDDAVLDEAYEITCHGEKKDWGREYLLRVARHESGHAFLCYMAGHTPSYLTIVARGNHGGYMEHSSEEQAPLSTREELIGRIRTSLGGRAAELVYYGPEGGISTGASGDLDSATRMARAMISVYGMDDEFGLAVLSREEANGPEVTKRVREILKQEMQVTVDTIRANRARIDRMVDALMKKNKLTAQEMEALLK